MNFGQGAPGGPNSGALTMMLAQQRVRDRQGQPNATEAGTLQELPPNAPGQQPGAAQTQPPAPRPGVPPPAGPPPRAFGGPPPAPSGQPPMPPVGAPPPTPPAPQNPLAGGLNPAAMQPTGARLAPTPRQNLGQ